MEKPYDDEQVKIVLDTLTRYFHVMETNLPNMYAEKSLISDHEKWKGDQIKPLSGPGVYQKDDPSMEIISPKMYSVGSLRIRKLFQYLLDCKPNNVVELENKIIELESVIERQQKVIEDQNEKINTIMSLFPEDKISKPKEYAPIDMESYMEAFKKRLEPGEFIIKTLYEDHTTINYWFLTNYGRILSKVSIIGYLKEYHKIMQKVRHGLKSAKEWDLPLNDIYIKDLDYEYPFSLDIINKIKAHNFEMNFPPQSTLQIIKKNTKEEHILINILDEYNYGKKFYDSVRDFIDKNL